MPPLRRGRTPCLGSHRPLTEKSAALRRACASPLDPTAAMSQTPAMSTLEIRAEPPPALDDPGAVLDTGKVRLWYSDLGTASR